MRCSGELFWFAGVGKIGHFFAFGLGREGGADGVGVCGGQPCAVNQGRLTFGTVGQGRLAFGGACGWLVWMEGGFGGWGGWAVFIF